MSASKKTRATFGDGCSSRQAPVNDDDIAIRPFLPDQDDKGCVIVKKGARDSGGSADHCLAETTA